MPTAMFVLGSFAAALVPATLIGTLGLRRARGLPARLGVALLAVAVGFAVFLLFAGAALDFTFEMD